MSPLPIRAGRALLLTLATGLAGAQQVRGPVMGFVVDAREHGIRPVLGVPGAAVVGPQLDAAKQIDAVAPSPLGNYVLVWVGESRRPALWLPAGELRALDGVTPGADSVALSPEGSAAVFYRAGDSRLEVVSGLPDQQGTHSIDLALLPGGITALAVSDDGALALVAEAGGAAVVLGAAGELNRYYFERPVSAMAFAPRTHDAVVAAGAEAVLLRGVEQPTARTSLTVSALGTVTAAAIAGDGRVFLAAAGSRKLATVVPGETPAIVECDCVPEGLFRMNDTSNYRLSGYAGGTMRVLDASVTPPRIVIVPPTLEADKQP